MLKLLKYLMIGVDVGLIAYLIYVFFFIDTGHYAAQAVDVGVVLVLLTAIWATKSIKLP